MIVQHGLRGWKLVLMRSPDLNRYSLAVSFRIAVKHDHWSSCRSFWVVPKLLRKGIELLGSLFTRVELGQRSWSSVQSPEHQGLGQRATITRHHHRPWPCSHREHALEASARL